MQGHKWFPTIRKPQGKVTSSGPAALRWSRSKQPPLIQLGKVGRELENKVVSKESPENLRLSGRVWLRILNGFYAASNVCISVVKKPGAQLTYLHIQCHSAVFTSHFLSGSNALGGYLNHTSV